jgi:hypothetical protein
MREVIEFGDDNMLVPIRHEHSNTVMLVVPGTGVEDLHVELVEGGDEGQTVVLPTWDLTDEQRQCIADGAQLTLVILQHPMPPVALALDGPFEAIHEDDPGASPGAASEETDPNEAAVRRDFHPDAGDQPPE